MYSPMCFASFSMLTGRTSSASYDLERAGQPPSEQFRGSIRRCLIADGGAIPQTWDAVRPRHQF